MGCLRGFARRLCGSHDGAEGEPRGWAPWASAQVGVPLSSTALATLWLQRPGLVVVCGSGACCGVHAVADPSRHAISGPAAAAATAAAAAAAVAGP